VRTVFVWGAVLSSNSERSDFRISDLTREKPVFGKTEFIRLISRERSVKPALKLDFAAHGIMESISEFVLCIPLTSSCIPSDLHLFSPYLRHSY
jgi:hypothetical protein